MPDNDDRGPKIPEDVRRAFLHRDSDAPFERTMVPINQGALVYEAPRDLAEALKVRGVGRVADEPRSILVALSERPTDDEMRALHNYLRTWPAISIGAEVEAEYYRQINEEGYDFTHDDTHREGELACAAIAYAMPEWLNEWMDKNDIKIWPFEGWPKFKNRRRDLVRAGALLIAEIARLDRSTSGGDG